MQVDDARLDDRDAELERLQREADVADLRAQLDAEEQRFQRDRASLANEEALLVLAERAVTRAEELVTSRAGSRSQLDDALQAAERQRIALAERRFAVREHASRKAQLEAQNLETKKEAGAIAAKLDGKIFVVIRSASDAGALYGSVTTRDAADAATAAGFSVDKKQVVLTRPIKELGLHEVEVVLHPEVSAQIRLNVARSNEEAELQASGKSIQELAAEAEAEAEFEIAELFDDIGSATQDVEETAE